MKKYLFLLFLFLFTTGLTAEEVEFEFFPGEEFNITEKQDLRQRKNGRYQGFIYRETRTSLSRDDWDENGMDYSGWVYVFQEMKRDSKLVARRLEDSSSCEIRFSYNGAYHMDEDQYQPSLRGVPSFPSEPVSVGEKWRAYGERIVRVSGEAAYTKVPIYCEYLYEGIKSGGGGDFHSITAQYALRYRGEDRSGDTNISNIDGSHKIEIRIPVDSPENIFMRDHIEEQYRMQNRDMITFSGVILTWFEAPVEYSSSQVEEDVIRIFGKNEDLREQSQEDLQEGLDEELGVIVKREDEGLVLSIPNIHFIPDSAGILPDEKGRLDGIAEVLRRVPNITFLVRGHTVDVGSRESQQILSEQRAMTIINELSERGIPENRFIYEGKGGLVPVDTNNTEEGRRNNRRVEIILLD
ncbi:MAG: OmpA family protein [Spirochaetales bacterium]|nr:OmpA family protein [Spirochaetales bacterium]